MEFVSDIVHVVLQFDWAFQIVTIKKSFAKKNAKKLAKINKKLSQVAINGTV